MGQKESILGIILSDKEYTNLYKKIFIKFFDLPVGEELDLMIIFTLII